jgi:hypothetical protein
MPRPLLSAEAPCSAFHFLLIGLLGLFLLLQIKKRIPAPFALDTVYLVSLQRL